MPNDFKASVSTQIKLHLKPNLLEDGGLVEIKRNIAKSENLRVSIQNYISAICAALDVPVCLKLNDLEYLSINAWWTQVDLSLTCQLY